jgi:hypothetical protein
MPDTKKNPLEHEKKEHKGSCASEQPQTCDKEKMTDEKSQKPQSAQKIVTTQPGTGHKHGGSCSH